MNTLRARLPPVLKRYIVRELFPCLSKHSNPQSQEYLTGCSPRHRLRAPGERPCDPRHMDGQADGRRVEKSRRSRCPGRVVRIDLGDGRCAYGRQLFSVQVEFYDHVGEPSQEVDLLDVVRLPVAFTTAVMNSALGRTGRWELRPVAGWVVIAASWLCVAVGGGGLLGCMAVRPAFC